MGYTPLNQKTDEEIGNVMSDHLIEWAAKKQLTYRQLNAALGHAQLRTAMAGMGSKDAHDVVEKPKVYRYPDFDDT